MIAMDGDLERLEPLVPTATGYAASPSQPVRVKSVMVRVQLSMDSAVQAFEKKQTEPGEPEVDSVQPWLEPG